VVCILTLLSQPPWLHLNLVSRYGGFTDYRVNHEKSARALVLCALSFFPTVVRTQSQNLWRAVSSQPARIAIWSLRVLSIHQAPFVVTTEQIRRIT
jgi:hypothetical protein